MMVLLVRLIVQPYTHWWNDVPVVVTESLTGHQVCALLSLLPMSLIVLVTMPLSNANNLRQRKGKGAGRPLEGPGFAQLVGGGHWKLVNTIFNIWGNNGRMLGESSVGVKRDSWRVGAWPAIGAVGLLKAVYGDVGAFPRTFRKLEVFKPNLQHLTMDQANLGGKLGWGEPWCLAQCHSLAWAVSPAAIWPN